jgi:nucleotide-binding universal stress UspA family protein
MDDRRLARQKRRSQNQRAIAGSSLFLLGLIAGLVGGLYLAWVVTPRASNTAGVEVLRPVYQADYLFMVSQSYAATGEWEQAATRLARLQDPNIDETAVALLEQYLREGRPAEQVRNLARLAERRP